MTRVCINGRLVALAAAKIPITDRSYLFGEGVFETLRIYDGHPAFFTQHAARLAANAAALHIPLAITPPQLHAQIRRVLAANRLRDATVRICVSPCNPDLSLEPSPRARTNIVLFARAPAQRPAALYRRGARVILIRGLTGDAAMAAIKSTSYASKMLARRHVRDAGADEGLFVAPRGIMLEGTATNLFVVHRGALLTPPIRDGVLPGVTRSVVLQLARAAGMRVRDARVTLATLRRADEVFLTGSTTEILPVREITELAHYRPPFAFARQLRRLYAQAVADDVRT